MPPRTDAFKHSGLDKRLRTSSTVILYFCVALSRDNLPGTKENTSSPVTGVLGMDILLVEDEGLMLSLLSNSGSGDESMKQT